MTQISDHNPALFSGMLISLLLLFHTASATQVTEKDLREMLGTQSWSSEELASLENGRVVVRRVHTAEKQEIASIGVLRIRNLHQISMTEFRASLSQKGNDSRKAGGRFSDPPKVEDLSGLELEKETIEELQKCSVGDCDLNLSADMITRIQRDVDWSSPNSKAQVTQLIRDMLLAYVQGYLARGDRSLGQYNNRRKSVDLAASHRALLSTSSLIKGLAPEFLNYLENFPTSQIDNAESGISWHIIDFGLKPSITVSHTAVYTQGDGDSKDLYVASKQIYSSRYLDSSLTFTLLLRVRTEAGVDSYLIFIDRSRSDALDGALGGLARKVVQNEATERIEKLLSRAELRLLATANSGDADKTLSDEDENSWTTAITDPRVVIILAGVLGLLLIFVIWRRNRQQVRP